MLTANDRRLRTAIKESVIDSGSIPQLSAQVVIDYQLLISMDLLSVRLRQTAAVFTVTAAFQLNVFLLYR